jgi:hypothetical protein
MLVNDQRFKMMMRDDGKGRAVSPYRTPPAPQLHFDTELEHRPADLIDVLFWALVVTVGLATASGGGRSSAADDEGRVRSFVGHPKAQAP